MLLAGLPVWPAGAAAQETDEMFENRVDPTHVFPQVNRTKYGSNMSMLAVVTRDGTTLSEVSENTIVAVFSGDEIRGKDIIYADQDNMAFVTIYGESTETLTFKVYWDGVVYDCGGSATFASDGFIGATDSPYELDISPVSLADNASNSETLTTWNTKTRDVVLTDRTLYKDGSWNTLCLPFSLSAEQIAADTDFAAATVMELDVTEKNGFDTTDGTLYLHFKTATAIEAGVPYLVKWEKAADYASGEAGHDISNPVFGGVTISSTAAQAVESTTTGLETVQMVGTYSPVSVTADDKSILFMGDANTLYYSSIDRQLRSCRAYFSIPYIKNHAGAKVRAFRLNFDGVETTGILEVPRDPDEIKDDAWYTPDGVRLKGKPAWSGIYIHEGKKTFVK